jgi:glycosyltransferase involved in cell wall biosynthesis
MDLKVSIAIPVYNGESFLERAIRSVIEQDFPEIEVVICDNASDDDTKVISERFAREYANVTYHRNFHNIGAGLNFNKAFSLCEGKYFKWAAHDDWISANYVGRCVEALDRHSDAVLAHGVTQCVDETGCPVDSIANELHGLQERSPVDRFSAVVNGNLGCFEIFGLIRREALSKTDLHQSYRGSDRALLAELALLGKFVHVPEARLYNRDHPKRSIRMADRNERLRWQDERLRGKASLLPLWSLVRHYIRLVFKHLRGGDRARGVLVVTRWLTKRHQLLELTVDLVALLSPSGAARLQKTAWDLWFAFRAFLPKLSNVVPGPRQ